MGQIAQHILVVYSVVARLPSVSDEALLHGVCTASTAECYATMLRGEILEDKEKEQFSVNLNLNL